MSSSEGGKMRQNWVISGMILADGNIQQFFTNGIWIEYQICASDPSLTNMASAAQCLFRMDKIKNN